LSCIAGVAGRASQSQFLRYTRLHIETRSSFAGTILSVLCNRGFMTSAPGTGAAGRGKETSLVTNKKRAARGEGGSSSLQSSDAARKDAAVVAAETLAPIVETSWDPYQVWLTRVKQPREQSARKRRQVRGAAEQAPAEESSETARLGTLTIVR
jgi:hypothetical protein